MNSSSSVSTGAATVTAASLEPYVSWALNGFPNPMPETLPYFIAACIITIGHALYNTMTKPKLSPLVVAPASAPVQAPVLQPADHAG